MGELRPSLTIIHLLALDFLFCPVDHLVFCTEMKTIVMSDIVNDYDIPPPNSLPEHSILKGTFHTSYFDNNSRQLNYPLGFHNIYR